jgi:hypothetical protein
MTQPTTPSVRITLPSPGFRTAITAIAITNGGNDIWMSTVRMMIAPGAPR